MIDTNKIQQFIESWDIEGIEKYLENFQDSKDPEIYYEMAKIYIYIYENEKAFYYYDKAISLGHRTALIDLVEDDEIHTAFILNDIPEFLSKYQNTNNPNILYQLGYIYLNHYQFKDKQKGFQYLEKAAKLNDANALFTLACHYYNKDFEKFRDYCQKAANLNHVYALFNLGSSYLGTHNEYPDEKKAYEYFKKAADLGHVYSQMLMSYYYLSNKDIEKCLHYLEVSTNNGQLGTLCKTTHLTYSYRHEQYKLKNLYEHLAKQYNNPIAHYQLGYMYLNNEFYFEEIDYNNAAYHFKIAAKQGYRDAKEKFLDIIDKLLDISYKKKEEINKQINDFLQEKQEVNKGDAD